jgi:hypothetical protein
MHSIDDPDCPLDLAWAVREFFPEAEWDHAVSVAKLESGWDAFALANTTDSQHPCGAVIGDRNGTLITAELSCGYFQINACNFPDWEWQRLYNARHNVGTAHMLWQTRGWQPWFFSAQTLGLG